MQDRGENNQEGAQMKTTLTMAKTGNENTQGAAQCGVIRLPKKWGTMRPLPKLNPVLANIFSQPADPTERLPLEFIAKLKKGGMKMKTPEARCGARRKQRCGNCESSELVRRRFLGKRYLAICWWSPLSPQFRNRNNGCGLWTKRRTP